MISSDLKDLMCAHKKHQLEKQQLEYIHNTRMIRDEAIRFPCKLPAGAVGGSPEHRELRHVP